jgi:hypothetical protein
MSQHRVLIKSTYLGDALNSGLILILVSGWSNEVSWPDDELNGRAAAWAAPHKAHPRAGRIAHPRALFATLDDTLGE